MKILQTQTLRGPNYWSIRRSKLILVRLDLEELAARPAEDYQKQLIEGKENNLRKT